MASTPAVAARLRAKSIFGDPETTWALMRGLRDGVGGEHRFSIGGSDLSNEIALLCRDCDEEVEIFVVTVNSEVEQFVGWLNELMDWHAWPPIRWRADEQVAG